MVELVCMYLMLLLGGVYGINILANPSFESNSLSGYAYMTPASWSSGGAAIVVSGADTSWGGGTPPDGNYYAALQGTASAITQDVAVVEGYKYTITLSLRSRPQWGGA